MRKCVSVKISGEKLEMTGVNITQWTLQVQFNT